MKKAKLILCVVVISVSMISCFPVLDFDFRNKVSDCSGSMLHDTLWIYGGYHRKATYCYVNSDWKLINLSGRKQSLILLNVKKIPNKKIYFTTDKKEIAYFKKSDAFSFDLKKDNITKLANKTIQHNIINRKSQYFINFDDKIFLIAGANRTIWDRKIKEGEKKYHGDVWVTSNGGDWKLLLEKGPWAKGGYRYGHEMIVFNNKIILIGGKDGDKAKKDVWASGDGIKWEFMGNVNKIGAVHDMLVHKNRLYIVGLKRNFKGKIFMSSNNLTDWETHDYIFNDKYGGDKLFKMNDNLMVLYRNSIWEFKDDYWIEQFNVRGFNGKIYINNDTLHSVINYRHPIKSVDGVNWYFDGKHKGTKLAPDKNFNPEDYRHEKPKIIEFKDTLWVLEGTRGLTNYSVDGLKWETAKKTMPENMFYPRAEFGATVFKNKLWVFAGNHKKTINPPKKPFPMYISLKDSWYTTNGTHWTEVPNNLQHSNSEFVTVVNNDTLYLVGGYDCPEIWATTNGLEWKHTMNFDTIKGGRKIKPNRMNAITFDSKIHIFNTYSNSSKNYSTLELNEKSKLTKFKNNLNKDNIVSFKNSLGNKLLIAKDKNELFISTDITNWNLINYTIDSSFNDEYPYSTLVEFKGGLYFVKKTDSVVNSTKVKLGKIPNKHRF